jgi:hypothetical protein
MLMFQHLDTPIPDIKAMNRDFPKGIENIIQKAMAKKPGDRYQNANEFLTALKELQGEKKEKHTTVPAKETKEIIEVQEQKEAGEVKEKIEETDLKPKEIQKKNGEKKSRPRNKLLLYILIIILIFDLVAFIMIKYPNIFKSKTNVNEQYRSHITFVKSHIESGEFEKATASLEEAKKIENTPEIKKFLNQIAEGIQISAMKKDFESLADRIGKEADTEKKQTLLNKFLANHKNTPEHKDKKNMLSWARNYITQLDDEIKTDNKIAAMKSDFQALKVGETLQGKAAKEEKIADCNNFLDKYKDISIDEKTTTMIEQTRSFIDKLNKEINDAEYERKNGKKEYDRIKGKIFLSTYLQFAKKHPQSVFIRDLKQKLRTADKNLPPEKYWTTITIDDKKDEGGKGYYKKTFANGHLMIYIPEKQFWIDKYEVSIKQFKKFDSNMSGNDDHPVTVTYDKAKSYCDTYDGFRLPTKDEWEYAAGKAKGYTYPWGNAAPDAGGIYRANFDSMSKDGEEKDDYNGTAPVKSFEQFSSPFGAVNMAGNVWEWFKDNTFKGGSYLSEEEDLRITKNFTAKDEDEAGFRCIKEEK